MVEDLENVLAWGGGDIVVPSRALECECVPGMLEIGHRSEPAGQRTRRPHVGRGLRWAALGLRGWGDEGIPGSHFLPCSGLTVGLRSCGFI